MEAETPGGADAPKTKEKSPEEQIQETLESMLSKKGLVKDQFLASKMNPQMYIPISVLLLHDRLQILGATKEQVAAAAAKSKRLGVDEQKTMVRPVLKSKRNVVILRDLPDGTTEEEIVQLLSAGPFADNVVSVKPEVNNTWFVKFNVDDGAQDVVLWLRSQTFKGKPVNAAIKSEHFLRSFFPVNQSMGFVPPGLPPIEGDIPPHGFAPAGFPAGGKGANFSDFMPPPGMMHPMQMGMQQEMPMMEPPTQFGLQSPGFWKSWGSRHRQPPLTFSADCPSLADVQAAAPWEAPSKGKGKGGKSKDDSGKGKSKKGKGAKSTGKWGGDQCEEMAPPGYTGVKGKPSWYEESEDVTFVPDFEDGARKVSENKAPKMKWAVKSAEVFVQKYY